MKNIVFEQHLQRKGQNLSKFWGTLAKPFEKIYISHSLIILSVIVFPLFGETITIENFQTDIFSKNTNDLKKIELNLVFETKQKVPTYKIKDGLNIVISSFYIEDLFTSKAKESFKTLLIDYLKKRDGVDIKSIYIDQMQIVDKVSVKELMKKIESISQKDKNTEK